MVLRASWVDFSVSRIDGQAGRALADFSVNVLILWAKKNFKVLNWLRRAVFVARYWRQKAELDKAPAGEEKAVLRSGKRRKGVFCQAETEVEWLFERFAELRKIVAGICLVWRHSVAERGCGT